MRSASSASRLNGIKSRLAPPLSQKYHARMGQRGLPLLLLTADAVGYLDLAHEPHDRSNLLFRDLGLGRHVPESPVMLPHTDLDGDREGRIAVVSRMIDSVDQRGPFVRA